jgi:hypothetical protein
VAQSLEAKGIPRDTDFLAEADERMSAVRKGLGDQAWEEALAKGRAMTLEEANPRYQKCTGVFGLLCTG